MLFNSYTFILFFGIVLVLHNLPITWRSKKINLLVASYLFYAVWNPPYVVLIWTSTLVTWFLARKIRTEKVRATKTALLTVGIAANIGLLSYFKYGQFLLVNLTGVLSLFHFRFQAAVGSIVLPLGISFYIFKALSYLIDVYKEKIGPSSSFIDLALYVTFFPQLLAGPIARASDFLSQCDTSKTVTVTNLQWGASLFLLGIFEKNVVSDAWLAPVADILFKSDGVPNFISAWTGTLAFAGQIFCDFAGYSTCAIGIALCLGFETRANFKFPYASIGFSDFWQRWHITLSSWFRDYLYIPMGGNRKGLLITQFNLMITMLLCGLWHGASWTFVVWGGLHGLYLVTERLLVSVMPKGPLWSTRTMKVVLALSTFVMVCFAWVFFNAKTFSQAFMILQAMLGLNGGDLIIQRLYIILTFVVMTALLSIHWIMRDRSLREVAENAPWWLRGGVLAALMIAIVIGSGDDRAFIYFQF